MGVAITLKQYLGLHVDDKDDVSRGRVLKVARKAHVPPEKIAKCVMLEDESGYVIAICPVTNRVRLGRLHRTTNRRLHFASDRELIGAEGGYFLGAVYPENEIYDIDVVIDDELLSKSDIYFEVGDGKELVHVQADDLQHLMQNAEHAPFSRPV